MQKFDRLPSMPGVAIKLIEAIQKPNPDIREITRHISSDAALSARLLKIINSPFYGLLNKITTIDQAIKLLGLMAVKNLSLSLLLRTSFLKKEVDSFNLTNFWKESLMGAIAAKLLAEQAKVKNVEDAFFLGLLKNIGSLTMAYLLPDQYSMVCSEINTKKISYQDAENQVFGFNHMDIGALLTKSWGLPETFYVPIQYHHCVQNLPESCDSNIRLRTAILHLSSLYIELFNSGTMTEVLGYLSHFIKSYGLENHLDAAEIGKELIKQIREVSPIFDLEFKNEAELEELLDNAKQELVNLSMQMVGEMIEKNSELELLRQQANRDAMTQLHNYKAFCEVLNQEIGRARRYKHELSLVLSDIDFFKSINDEFGHPAGDQVLKAVARTLQGELRDSDFVARYGGEEFAIILPETKLKDALYVAERLREKIKLMEISYDRNMIRLTMSFGVAAFRASPAMSFNDLVKAADDALYAAKKLRRDRCCVTQTDHSTDKAMAFAQLRHHGGGVHTEPA
jgi:diguanylate cyclase (GGDEF)-like protein